jgi:hypothetical protein
MRYTACSSTFCCRLVFNPRPITVQGDQRFTTTELQKRQCNAEALPVPFDEDLFLAAGCLGYTNFTPLYIQAQSLKDWANLLLKISHIRSSRLFVCRRSMRCIHCAMLELSGRDDPIVACVVERCCNWQEQCELHWRHPLRVTRTKRQRQADCCVCCRAMC